MIFTIGGKSINVTEDHDFNKCLDEWYESDDTYSVYISLRDNGIIPLWDFLPPEYNHLKDDMEREFNIYKNTMLT